MAKYFTKDITVTIAGQKKRVKVRGKTPQERDDKVLEWRIRERNGELTINSNTTVSAWFKDWIETYKKPSVCEKEYKRYIGILNNYMNPTIGGMKLKDVRHITLQRIINDFTGMSDSTISFVMKMVKAGFKRAAKNKLVDYSIIDDLVRPQGTTGERRSLINDERRAFHIAMDKHKYGLMFGIILACGLRPEEVRALSWPNMNLTNGEVTINRAVKSGTKTLGDPKSKAGLRVLKMPNWYLDKFKEYAKKKESLFVFPSGETKGIMSEQHFYRSWKSFKRLMDIEMGATVYRNKVIESVIAPELTPYYLRHTFCTDLAAAGVPLKTAQYLMGHSDINITARIYTHFEDSMRDKAVVALNKYQKKKIQDNEVRQKVRHSENKKSSISDSKCI